MIEDDLIFLNIVALKMEKNMLVFFEDAPLMIR